MARPRLEKAFQTAFLIRLRKIPTSRWAKLNDRSTIGLPDVFGVVDGLPVMLELKRRGERLTPLQHRTLLRYEKAGALVGVVDEDGANEWILALGYYAGSAGLGNARWHTAFYGLERLPAHLLPKKKIP